MSENNQYFTKLHNNFLPETPSVFGFRPIGFIDSCYPDKFGTPRQPGLNKNAISKLKLNNDLQPEISLEGLSGFSHVWIIFLFHLNTSSRFHAKVHPPRLNGGKMGLFATRTPHRPNPIGLSLVELQSVDKDTLTFVGADLVHGTPVFDIKPYLPFVESVSQAKTGWVDSQGEIQKVSVIWSEEALNGLNLWAKNAKNFKSEFGSVFLKEQFKIENIRSLIESTLEMDPRPTVYKGFNNDESPYRTEHAFRLYDYDVHFKFIGLSEILVLKVIPFSL